MLSKIVKRCFSTSGSLLTWGETTFGWGRPINEQYYTPGVVEGFNNIAHVASGPYHLTFATAESNVYTVGHGKNGRLGNGTESDADTPVKVDINGKITQLACGTRHTLALTDSGDVYAWGYGGKPASFGCSWLGVHSPLGNGTTGSSFSPVKVNLKNVSQISAGNDISFALSNGLVYSWGQGLSRFHQDAVSTPQQFIPVNALLETKKTGVKKIASTDSFAMFLLENGKLYAIGRNNGGVLATRHNDKIITDNHLDYLTSVNDHPLHGQKVIDFQISANSLILRTESNSIFYSGMHSKYMPTPFPSKVQAKSIFATTDSVGIIGQDNKIYFLNDPIVDDYDKQGEVMVSDQENLKGAFKIGGTHELRFALRQ